MENNNKNQGKNKTVGIKSSRDGLKWGNRHRSLWSFWSSQLSRENNNEYGLNEGLDQESEQSKVVLSQLLLPCSLCPLYSLALGQGKRRTAHSWCRFLFHRIFDIIFLPCATPKAAISIPICRVWHVSLDSHMPRMFWQWSHMRLCYSYNTPVTQWQCSSVHPSGACGELV